MESLGHDRLGEVLCPCDRRSAKRRDRDRIGDWITDHPFTDYWDIFVMKHQNAANIALHVLGVVIFYGVAALAMMSRKPVLLLLLPLSQMVGLLGHYFFERSHIDLQDAVFSARASRCLNKMFLRIITGRYGRDIRRANDELKAYQLARDRVARAQERECG